MKSIINKIAHDGVYSLGLILILLSFLLFLLPEFHLQGASSKMEFTVFVTNYIISIIYFFVLWFKKIKYLYADDVRASLEYGFLHLILCLISAYSLNREMTVFENSTSWLQALLIINSLAMILMFFKDQFPAWVRRILFFILGTGFVLFLYLTIYLLPLFALGVIGFFVLGLSLHVFVPAAFIITVIMFMCRSDNRAKVPLFSFSSGIIFSVLVIIVFTVRWSSVNSVITKANDRVLLDEKGELPAWVYMAQTLPKNSFSEKLMKAGLVFTAAPDELEWGIFDRPSRNYNEARKHDPLVMISTFFCGNPRNAITDRINILESMYDSRHHAQERLWNGDDLKTSHVITNVRLFPGLRIGYTEKIISIRNHNPRNLWNPSEEAIYTFHLPEGGVVTSLSLWINGKEEKAILTAKNKADSAYRTIVGRESRDPSLVRWQEGNTVSVRVFPCTPDEDRKFKMGITAPLTPSGNKLNYQNIWFDGPEVRNADESIQFVTMDDAEDLDLPARFRKINDNTWLHEGNYKHDWEVSLACPPLKGNNFSFDGQSYSIAENVRNFSSFNLQTIYLDLNSSWSKSEFNKILKMVGDKEICVFTDKLKKITPSNSDELFNELSNLNFSLFPFHKVKSSENSIVITKGTTSSPNLLDLADSEFADNIKAYFLKKPQIRVFNLGAEISPFIKTLTELRAFEFDLGDIDYLTSLIRERKFIINPEDKNSVVVKTAAIRITQKEGESAPNAPDHLMRLFSYNQVMSQIGVNYLKAGFEDSTIVSNAYKAYVVSPVTSLVVLETKKDYERFNIKDQGSSLKNASMKSSGAVPEPHEWLLIALMAGLALFLYFRKRKVVF